MDPLATRLALSDAQVARVYQDALDHTDYLVLNIPLARAIWGQNVASVRSYVVSHFRLVRSAQLYIYVRNGYPVA